MLEDVPCDIYGVAHEDAIGQPGSVDRDTTYTGLQLIQQERLRAYTEMAQYRLDLASVKGTYLFCRANRQS